MVCQAISIASAPCSRTVRRGTSSSDASGRLNAAPGDPSPRHGSSPGRATSAPSCDSARATGRAPRSEPSIAVSSLGQGAWSWRSRVEPGHRSSQRVHSPSSPSTTPQTTSCGASLATAAASPSEADAGASPRPSRERPSPSVQPTPTASTTSSSVPPTSQPSTCEPRTTILNLSRMSPNTRHGSLRSEHVTRGESQHGSRPATMMASIGTPEPAACAAP